MKVHVIHGYNYREINYNGGVKTANGRIDDNLSTSLKWMHIISNVCKIHYVCLLKMPASQAVHCYFNTFTLWVEVNYQIIDIQYVQ